MRKYAWILTIAGLFVSGMAFAGESYSHCVSSCEPSVVNNTNVTVESREYDPFTYGVGVDTVVYKSGSPWIEEVRVDTRYNVEYSEWSAFAVAKVDLWDVIKGAK